MGFDVYYSRGTARIRKHFDNKGNAVAWADAHTDEDPEVFEQVPAYKPDRAGVARREGGFQALTTFLNVLDGWEETAMSNHDALGHRGEAEPCWQIFHTEDIRRMVDDTAQELGIKSPRTSHKAI